MASPQWLKREVYVAIHAQSWRFRVVKYAIIVPFFGVLWFWTGWRVMLAVLVALFVVAIGVHLLFRWKTKAWTRSWGPYKKIDLPV